MDLRCEFEIVSVGNDSVVIRDKNNGRMSVTNDAENVCKYLFGIYSGRRIFYRDSENVMSELCHQHGVFTGFGDQ